MEAALILPIIVLLAMGLIEFSSAELQDSQATSAARDGARVGILDYKDLDDPSSAARQAVVAAAQKRVTGQTALVDMRCIDGAGSTIACSGARPDVDRLEVEARWEYTSVTAFGLGVPSEIVGTSRMALVGTRVAVSAPPPPTTTTSTTSTTTTTTQPPTSTCAVTSTVNVNPQTGGGAHGNGNKAGELKKPLTISNIVLNGHPSCGTPSIRIWPGGSGTTTSAYDDALSLSGASWTHTYPADENRGWKSGQVTFQILAGDGTVAGTFTFTLP